ncbi:hypothetical protein C4J81_15490 [Deltaproteobacteria bacterium Smac51]|nr:hypothetical protein C4J81_15490 [Deltaproteobacteria bacterium Smac51]
MADAKYTGQIKKIRAWLRDNPSGEVRDLYENFGGQEMRATFKAIDYLKERRELTLSQSLYNFRHQHGNASRETKQTAIFTVMRNLAKGGCLIVPFQEIVDVAVVDESYARRYLNFLQDLRLIQIRRSPKGETNIAVYPKVFSLTDVPHYDQRQERKKVKGAGK